MKKEIRCQVVKNGIDFRAQSTSLLLVEFTKRLEGGGGASFPRLGSLIEVVSRGQEIPSTHRVRVFVGVGSKEGSAEEENEKGKRRKRKRKGKKKRKERRVKGSVEGAAWFSGRQRSREPCPGP